MQDDRQLRSACILCKSLQVHHLIKLGGLRSGEPAAICRTSGGLIEQIRRTTQYLDAGSAKQFWEVGASLRLLSIYAKRKQDLLVYI